MDEVFKALGLEWPDWPQNDENLFQIKTAEKYFRDLHYRNALLVTIPTKSKEFIVEIIAKRCIIKTENEWESFALSCIGEELKMQAFGEKQFKLREIFQSVSLTVSQSLAAMAYFASKSYLTLSIDCLVQILSSDNIDNDQKHYSILHLVNSFNPEWHLKEARKNESLADGIIRFFDQCSCIKKTDIKKEKIQSTIASFCKIKVQLEEFDDWIHLPLHAASINIKDGNINEAVKIIQHKLSSFGIAIDESEALARSCASKLAMRLGSWDEASKLLKESNAILKEYSKIDSLKNSILPIVHAEVELLSHELSIALANNSLKSQRTQNCNQGQDYNSLSRSQLGQDLWVLKKLDWMRNGYFVEFGATDGVLLNNTWLLEKHFGWDGVCAEPNPKFLMNLKINRSCSISDKCVFSATNQTVEFVLADVYGGIKNLGNDDNHKAKRDAYANNGQVIQVDTISLVDLLNEHNAPREIDYLSIDTEGSEFEILNAFDWESFSIKCITVEHNYTPMRQQIRELLTSRGYVCEEAQWDDWYFKS